MQRELIVVGVGPGAADQMTPAAAEAVPGAGCAVAAPRHLPLVAGHANVLTLGRFSETLDRVAEELERGTVAVLVSGDPGLYSLLPLLKRRFPTAPLRVLPGVSSLQSLCAAAGETWADAAILSGHGRPLTASRLLNAVERGRLTALFCGDECSPRWACEALAGAVGGLEERVEVVVGERLSYPDQRVTRGRPAELAGRDFDPLSLVLLRNAEPWTPPFGRPKDEDFVRGRPPMTRAEVRSVVLDRLELTPDAVLWDVGAGTGSVSVAAALACPDGEVHALECVPEALELLERNRERFRLHNMTIHAGRALALLDGLPRPTHAFVGGSGGELEGLLDRLSTFDGCRVLVSAVTLDTLARAATILKGPLWHGLEAVQVAVAASRPLGQGLLMAGSNPVTLLGAWAGSR